MTRVGIVGLGFMGMVHYLTWGKLPGVEVVALCDRKATRRAGDWTDIQGNFGPPGEQMDLGDLATYATPEELIADPNVELVDITLPPALHAETAQAALTAGKDVLCEKPMAMNLADCDRMLAAAEAAGRRLLIGHVLPFFPEYAWALREIRSGMHGQLLSGSLKRIISDPAWLPNYWNAAQIGGPLLDLHVHDAHFLRLAFGAPRSVTSRGSLRDGLPEHWHSLLEFDDPALVAHVAGGVIGQPGRPFLHGFELRLERATLMFEFAVIGERAAYLCPPTILTPGGGAQRVELGDGDPMNAFHAELSHALAALAGEAPADALDASLARDAILICQQQAESLIQSR